MKKSSLHVSALAALLAFATHPATLHAADGTWTGASGATWNTSATNWTGVSGTPWDGTNGPTNNATFSATSGNASISGTVTANRIINAATSGSFLIQGGNLTLGGTTPTINQLNPRGDLTISSAVLGTAGLAKAGSGTLVLSGNNTYTGNTTISGGRLVLDYSGLSNTADPLSTGLVSIDSGALTLRGKTSGTTTETISSINFPNSGVGFSNSITLDSNGGSGISLTVSTFNTVAQTDARSTNLIDLSSNAANALTITNLGTGARSVNGVLMGGAGSDATSRANLVVRDSASYGFATRNGTTGAVGRLTTGTTLDASNTSNSTNFFLTSGSVTRAASLNYQTLTLDSGGGTVTLDMGGNNLVADAAGRGILATGANDINIIGGGRIEGAASAWVQNYSTGNLTVGLSTSNATATSLMFGGSGFTIWTGTSSAKGALQEAIFAQGGTILRVATAQNWSSNATGMGGNIGSRMIVTSGAVLEVGADLNGATAGDLDLAVGTDSKLRFWGDSGLSASGGNRTVNFGGAGAAVTWGSSNFLTAPTLGLNIDGNVDGNYIFKLSSAKSDSTLTLQNGIALGSAQRVIEVANGSAAADAILSGNLTSTGGGITKTGSGTLVLSGTNTYTGATTIAAGTLEIGNGGTTGSLSTSSAIFNNGTLAFNRSIVTQQGADFAAAIGGSGNVVQKGGGALALYGVNTYTGSTTIDAGEVWITADSGLGSAPGSFIADQLRINNAQLRVQGNTTISSNRGITLGSSGVGVISVDGTRTVTYGGVVSGGNFTKSGNGALILSGTNTYTGNTTVSAGTLLINGNSSAATGAVSVSANATLGGNGTLGGAVSIANNGILAPGTTGDATTTLTLNNTNLTISGIDSKINLDITGTAAGAFDRIAGINAFTQGGDITFTLTGSYTNGDLWNVFGFTSKSGTFNSVALTGDYSGTLNWDGSNWTNTNIGGQSWQFDEAAGTLSVIPEPSTWALLAASLTTLVIFRRRRARI